MLCNINCLLYSVQYLPTIHSCIFCQQQARGAPPIGEQGGGPTNRSPAGPALATAWPPANCPTILASEVIQISVWRLTICAVLLPGYFPG